MVTTEKAPQESQSMTIRNMSPELKELLRFANMPYADTTDVDDLILFKQIDLEGTITEINSDKAVTLYKNMKRRNQSTSFPIFELKDTDNAILPIQGIGFGGAIWAKVLLNKTNLEIIKIDFGHRGESEGYGDAMTQTSFENQFEGTKINLMANTFTLQKAMERAKDDGRVIDGISGATMTSQGVVDMVNEGMKRYRNYLSPETTSK